MQTLIHPELKGQPKVEEANSILRSCVHCGFCLAACPTYQLSGNELDSPRGRIYLLKNLLEEDAIEGSSALHLDQCLTCRACETACPSGVKYSRLLDIGRELIATRQKQRLPVRLLSQVVRLIVPRDYLFRPLLMMGQFLAPILPTIVAGKIPPVPGSINLATEELSAPRLRVLLLRGCVQRAATPNVFIALKYLLNEKGVTTSSLTEEGCCGALDYHMSAHETGRRRMRDLVDRLDDHLEQVDYIVSTASGCGATLKEYPIYLSEDPEYVVKSRRINEKVVDVVELLGKFDFSCVPIRASVHTPCSLQHGQSIDGEIERLLDKSGVTVTRSARIQPCCGSAGSYSIMHPGIAGRLRDRRLKALEANSPDVIVSANIGCQLHLQSGSGIPVMHWVELLQQQLVEALDEDDASFT